MGDFTFVAIFLACCVVTGGLLILCERLMQSDVRPTQGGKP